MTRRSSPRDCAPSGMRLHVSQAAAQAWQDPAASAHYLGRAMRCSVRFKVQGMRTDGSLRGVRTAQWLVARLPGWILTTVWVVLTIVIRVLLWIAQFLLDAAFNSTSASYKTPTLRWGRRVEVTAAAMPASGAVSFGQALQRGRGHLWIVASPHRLALTQIVNESESVLWFATSPDLPMLSIEQAELRWPDTSCVSFSWPKSERRLQHAQYAAAYRQPGF